MQTRATCTIWKTCSIQHWRVLTKVLKSSRWVLLKNIEHTWWQCIRFTAHIKKEYKLKWNLYVHQLPAKVSLLGPLKKHSWLGKTQINQPELNKTLNLALCLKCRFNVQTDERIEFIKEELEIYIVEWIYIYFFFNQTKKKFLKKVTCLLLLAKPR